jgi:hypothetical protein
MMFGKFKNYDPRANELIKSVIRQDWPIYMVSFGTKKNINGNTQTECRLYALDDNHNMVPLTEAFARIYGTRFGKRQTITMLGNPRYACQRIAERLEIIASCNSTPEVRLVEE